MEQQDLSSTFVPRISKWCSSNRLFHLKRIYCKTYERCVVFNISFFSSHKHSIFKKWWIIYVYVVFKCCSKTRRFTVFSDTVRGMANVSPLILFAWRTGLFLWTVYYSGAVITVKNSVVKFFLRSVRVGGYISLQTSSGNLELLQFLPDVHVLISLFFFFCFVF